MNNIDQIAAEAESRMHYNSYDSARKHNRAIIKSACEKAYDAGWNAACREAVAPKAARTTASEAAWPKGYDLTSFLHGDDPKNE